MKPTKMETVTKLIMVVILLSVLGCFSSRPDVAEITSSDDQVRVYEIFGMNCPGCHGGLEKLVNKIPGVEKSKANWEEQRLEVVMKLDFDINDSDIFGAIERANFTPGKRLQ